MTAKTERRKGFDCVDFKRRSQERLRKEYEARRGEFASYAEFLNAKVHEDKWSRALWEAFARTVSRE